MEFAATLIWGVFWGLGATVPIGPVNTEIARRTLRYGFTSGASVGTGAVTIDMIFCSAAMLGLGVHLGQNPTLLRAITAGGILMLSIMGSISLYQSWAAWKKIQLAKTAGDSSPIVADAQPVEKPTVMRGFLTGLAMTAFNPYAFLFWFGILPSLAASQIQNARSDVSALLIGVLIGTLGWVLFFTGVLHKLKQFSTDLWVVIADLGGGLILLGFAGFAIYTLLRGS